jgi:hypothetical protein
MKVQNELTWTRIRVFNQVVQKFLMTARECPIDISHKVHLKGKSSIYFPLLGQTKPSALFLFQNQSEKYESYRQSG